MASDSLPDDIHPAPERHKASVTSLSLALLIPPLVWSAQSIVGYSVSSRACFSADSLRTTPAFNSMWAVLLTINLIALVICLVSALSAYRNWSTTRHERGGDSSHLIERGEGRTRFLAMSGMLVGAGFMLATAFSLISLLLSPLCR